MNRNIKKSPEVLLFSLSFVKSLVKIVRFVFKQKTVDKTLIVISLHKLGDSVFTIPAVKAIIQHYKNYKIYLVCFHSGKIIYNSYFKSNNIHILSINNHKSWCQTRFPSWRLIKQLRNLKPEIFFDIMGNQYSFILGLFVGAGKNFGMNKPHLSLLYDRFCEIRTSPHLMDRYLDAACLEIPKGQYSVEKLFPPDYDKRGVIFINPFAGWKAKEWELEKFVNLASKLNSIYNICFIYEKNSLDNDLLIKNNIKFVETESIQDLIDHLKKCALIIGCDSGPIYIASMLGKPTLTLYGPTNPDYSFPFGQHHKYYRQVIHCSPLVEQYCHLDAGRNCPKIECLNLLKVDDVLREVVDFIKELGIDNKEL